MTLEEIEVWLKSNLKNRLDGVTMVVNRSETELVADFVWMRHMLANIVVFTGDTEATVRFLEVELAPSDAIPAADALISVANFADDLETALGGG